MSEGVLERTISSAPVPDAVRPLNTRELYVLASLESQHAASFGVEADLMPLPLVRMGLVVSLGTIGEKYSRAYRITDAGVRLLRSMPWRAASR